MRFTFEEAARRRILEEKKGFIPVFEKGVSTKLLNTIEETEQKALQLLGQYKLFAHAVKPACMAVTVLCEGTEHLAPSDDVFQELLKGSPRPPQVSIQIGIESSAYSTRDQRAVAAQKEGKVGGNTGVKTWFAKFADKLQAETDDYWRGMFLVLSSATSYCFFCGELVNQHKNRPYDTDPIINHVEGHARSIARSAELKRQAQIAPPELPPLPTNVPVSGVPGEYVNRTPTAEEKNRAVSCIGRVWDVQHPYSAGIKPNDFDENLYPVLLIGNSRQEKQLKRQIQAQAVKIRAERLQKQRMAATQRQLEAQEKKKKKFEEEEAARAKARAAKTSAEMTAKKSKESCPISEPKRRKTAEKKTS